MATVVQKYRFYTGRSTKLITRSYVKWFLRLYELCETSAFVVATSVSDYSNKLQVGLGRCHFEQKSHCFKLMGKFRSVQ